MHVQTELPEPKEAFQFKDLSVAGGQGPAAAFVAGAAMTVTPTAVAFGNFDGVHLGHRALIASLRRAADRLGAAATIVTFDPHPLTVLRPGSAPLAVDPLATRLELLAACGVDRTIVLRFDADLAAKSAEWFVTEALCRRLGARAVLVGADTRFGCGGRGDLALLRSLATEHGAEVEIAEGVSQDGALVSSSRVRAAIATGAVAEAATLLARPFCLRGVVVRGDARGRTIGFPTANVSAPGQIQPAAGVYACLAEVTGEDGATVLRDAVVNVGTRPTFDGTRVQVEAHLPGWAGDLYDRVLPLHFIARLRNEQRFGGIDALVAQIRRDVDAALVQLAAWRSSP